MSPENASGKSAPTAAQAAEAAALLIAQQSQLLALIGRARRLRFWTLAAGALTVVMFCLCVITGHLLHGWYTEGLVTRGSPSDVWFTEKNLPLVVWGHIVSSVALAVFLIGHVALHGMFRRAYRALPLAKEKQFRIVSPVWVVALAGVLGLALFAAFAGGKELPRKPPPDVLFDQALRSMAAPSPETMDYHPLYLPRGNAMTDPAELWANALLRHTLAIPVLMALLLFFFLGVVYNVQRVKFPVLAEKS